MDTNAGATRHEITNRLPRNEAVKRLHTEVINFGRTAAEYLANDREGDAPVRVIRAEAGLGKSTATLEEIRQALRANADLRILYMVPSLDLGEELATKAREAGIDARVLRGRSQPRPDGDGTMCAKSEIAETIAALSLSVTETLCRKKLDNGETVECPFAATCPYLAQLQAAKRGGLIIASHQYLAVRMEALKDVDWLVIDESFWQVLTADKRIPLDRFLSLRVTGDGFRGKKGESKQQFEERRIEADYELGQAVESFRLVVQQAEREKRPPTLADFRAEGFTAEICGYLSGLEYSRITTPDIHPGMDFEVQKDRLQKATVQEAFTFARAWKILGAELDSGREGAPHGFMIERGVLDPKSGELHNHLRMFWSRDPRIKDTPTLIIDADADSAIIERFYPGAVTAEISAAWRHVELIQCHDRTGSAQALKGHRRRDEVYNAALDMADRLADQIEGKATRRPLLVSQKSVIDAYRDGGDLEAAPFDVAHFGNLRGKDGWKEAAGIVVAGRIEPSPAAIEAMARGIWYASAEPLAFLEPEPDGRLCLPRQAKQIEAKDGEAREVQVSYHPDPRADRVLRQVREAELMQAIARIRPIHRSAEIPCQIVVLSNVPLPVQPDRLASWAELVPDRFDMARLAGFMPDKSGDMADSYPDIFPSATAVRTAATRREQRALGGCFRTHIEHYIETETPPPGWVRVSYQRPAKVGNRTGTGWVKHRPGDTPARIAARVAAFLVDAFAIEAEIPVCIVETAPQAGRIDPAGFKTIDRAELFLAVAYADEAPWWQLTPARKKFYTQERRQP